jgi:hypothetical protein
VPDRQEEITGMDLRELLEETSGGILNVKSAP